MSFSLDVKTDLLTYSQSEEAIDKLEIESMIRISGEIGIIPVKLSLTSNNSGIIRRFLALTKKYYKVDTNILKRVIDRFDSHTSYTAEITEGADKIISDLNLFSDASEYKKNINIQGMNAYLRGAFLVRGSVNDPNARSNHLEISSTNEEEILFIQRIMNDFELNARITKRKNYLVLYIKAREAITDFLYHIGCKKIMESYQNAIITRAAKTVAKRSVNLTLANQDKTNASAKEQLKYIEYLEYNYPLENLDSRLLMVMKVRKDYPDYSLMDLLDIIHEEYDPKLTKSGLNHRFRRIKEIALEYKKKDN